MKLGNKTKILSMAICVAMIMSLLPFAVSASAIALDAKSSVVVDSANNVATITVEYTGTDCSQVTVLAMRSKSDTVFPTLSATPTPAELAEIKYIDQQAGAAGAFSGKFVFKVTLSDFSDSLGKYLHVKVGGTDINTPASTADAGFLGNAFDIEPSVTVFIFGDANGDGLIDSTDASVVMQFSALVRPDLPEGANVDVNSDGTVDSTDGSILMQFAAFLRDKLPERP